MNQLEQIHEILDLEGFYRFNDVDNMTNKEIIDSLSEWVSKRCRQHKLSMQE